MFCYVHARFCDAAARFVTLMHVFVTLMHISLKFGPDITSIASKPKAPNVIAVKHCELSVFRPENGYKDHASSSCV